MPDSVVRAADQIELEDMTAEALRRRLAHGNVYAPEKVDAALSNYFRTGNLNALRELALLWTADRVDDALQDYREKHGITGTWEARERVVVALTGGPEGETLIRRAARIAARSSGGDLLAVHVARSDGLAGASQGALASQRLLVESLGGTYHQVLGDDVPAGAALLRPRGERHPAGARARAVGPPGRASSRPGTATHIVRQSGDIDVHLVTHSHTGRGVALPHGRGSLSTRRKARGYVLALVLPALLTVALTPVRGQLNLVSDMLLFLLITVVVALVGGLGAGADRRGDRVDPPQLLLHPAAAHPRPSARPTTRSPSWSSCSWRPWSARRSTSRPGAPGKRPGRPRRRAPWRTSPGACWAARTRSRRCCSGSGRPSR